MIRGAGSGAFRQARAARRRMVSGRQNRIGKATAYTTAVASLLVGVSATDPATFVLAPAVLTAVALLASAIPARRASRLDPLVALRTE